MSKDRKRRPAAPTTGYELFTRFGRDYAALSSEEQEKALDYFADAAGDLDYALADYQRGFEILTRSRPAPDAGPATTFMEALLGKVCRMPTTVPGAVIGAAIGELRRRERHGPQRPKPLISRAT